ncbi:MAG: hypothetical protein M1828_004011 [Chrysothrix sp. TS-e1954]|nr:MAG: hypothetical protein M1828_004011 [Chrysothrix sp. TS-e1954]
MDFERPRTPDRSYWGSSVHNVTIQNTLRSADSARTQYVPHLFDLIYPARDAINECKLHVPSTFREAEAVDSSVLLGHGASFTASLQKIPGGPETVETKIERSDSTTTVIATAPRRPEYVVYKIARVAFNDEGQPLREHQIALQSILNEFHALIYPPLFEHENIIDFLGLAWGSNPFSTQHQLPAIIVEYAEHGTLAEVLKNNKQVTPDDKQSFCLDAARGLSALHESGLVHGDVKAENVLVCKGKKRRPVAKLADFGFSIISATESDEVYMGGTNPWRAPECLDGPIKLVDARCTDTYSYGLMVWVVCLEGQSPFDYVGEHAVEGIDAEQLKRTGKLLESVKCDDWMRRFLRNTKSAGLKERAAEAAQAMLSKHSLATSSALLSMAYENFLTTYTQQHWKQKLTSTLPDILKYSLNLDPAVRELDIIIALLQSNATSEETEANASAGDQIRTIQRITNTGDKSKHFTVTAGDRMTVFEIAPSVTQTVSDVTTRSAGPSVDLSEIADQSKAYWRQRGYKVSELCSLAYRADVSCNQKHWFSWQKTRELTPSVQSFVVESVSRGSSSSELFTMGSYLMNGYGCEPGTEKALASLRLSAEIGFDAARAYLFRIWDACRPGGVNPGFEYLHTYASNGSRVAFEDFKRSGTKKEIEKVERWLSDAECGVGADWLENDRMLNGFTQSQWINDQWCMDQVRATKKPLSELVINERGDSVLHLTAMCGRWKPFKALVITYGMDINIRNPLGETPLLSACRSGHGGIVIICLRDFKADASIAANNGETPLHWLTHFDDLYIEPMIQDLIANGAKLDAATTVQVGHAKFSAHIDMDFQMPGTALTWAVHDNRPHIVRALLKHGAEPYHFGAGASSNAVDTAAYYHHHECLKFLIEHLESKVTRRTSDGQIDKRHALFYAQVVHAAEKAADKFSMILRGGADYLHRLHATLDLLREKTEYINFQGNPKVELHNSLLYTAVSRGHDEVVGYMLDRQWLVQDRINFAAGEARRTPVLEAIRWNRESLVQTLVHGGADAMALAANPFDPQKTNWSALHIFAHEGHNKDLELMSRLVNMGVPIDGSDEIVKISYLGFENDVDAHTAELTIDDAIKSARDCESPFSVAVRRNAFSLATRLLELKADPNSLSYCAGLYKSPRPLTVLGHVIISNARYSSARLRYLIDLASNSIDFIVEPTRKLTALHRCAMGHRDISKTTSEPVLEPEFDKQTNANIMYELLLKWRAPEDLDAQCDIHGNTALHLAVEAQNFDTMEELVQAGAQTGIYNSRGERAIDILSAQSLQSRDQEWLARLTARLSTF